MLTRIARAAALVSILLATPALAENKKAVVSQAFQSMLYLPLYVAIDEGFFTQQGLDLTKETAGAPSVALSAVDLRQRAILDPRSGMDRDCGLQGRAG